MNMSSAISVGVMVRYTLTEQDAKEINRRREPNVGHAENWPKGAQAHVGNPVGEGEEVAMVIVAVWPKEFDDGSGVNGQVLLDGNDSLWVTSIRYNDEKVPGTWHY
jgi:hypothetical protein